MTRLSKAIRGNENAEAILRESGIKSLQDMAGYIPETDHSEILPTLETIASELPSYQYWEACYKFARLHGYKGHGFEQFVTLLGETHSLKIRGK